MDEPKLKLLLDSCISPKCVEPLVAAGYMSIHASSLGPDPGDEHLLRVARENQQVLVTQDKDFGELWIRDPSNAIGIIRLVSLRAKDQADSVINILARHSTDLAAGGIVTFDGSRIRVRLRPS